MAYLSPEQFDFLKTRQNLLKDKPCPVCGSIEEKEILDQHFQLLSNYTPNGVIGAGIQRFTSLGLIKCPKCDFFYPFLMDTV